MQVIQHIFSRNRFSVALLACAAFAAAPAAHAGYYCVASSNALQNALTQSSNGGAHANEDNLIEIVQGTYLTGSSGFHYYSTSPHTLIVEGGYTTGCASRVHVTSSTVLDGRHATNVLVLSNANGTIAVDGLTLQNGESGIPGGGLSINYLASVSGAVHVMNNIIRGNHSSVDAGGIYMSGAGGETWLFNNLITDNASDEQYGAGYITGYGQFNEVFQNTVTKNTAAGDAPAVGGLYCGGSRFCQITNNIFWNNTNFGVYLGNGGAVLEYNDYGTRGGAAPAQSIGDGSVAPQFVNASAGNFRLSSGSPLRDYSPEHVSEYDLDGHDSPTQGNVDIGAYQHQ